VDSVGQTITNTGADTGASGLGAWLNTFGAIPVTRSSTSAVCAGSATAGPITTIYTSELDTLGTTGGLAYGETKLGSAAGMSDVPPKSFVVAMTLIGIWTL
jgi:hypothetical protein